MAANTPTTPNTGAESPASKTMKDVAQQLLRKPAFKRLAVLILSFITAFIALSIINVIFTHAIILSSYLFHSTTPTESLTNGGVPKRTKQEGKPKRVKTVYVGPTQDDLSKILIEIESSETLHNKNNGESATKRVKSIIDELQSLKEQKAYGIEAAVREVEELAEAYDSFLERFDDDIALYRANQGEKKAAALDHLSQFMKRTSFIDLNRDELDDMVENVVGDLNVLVENDDILRNSNRALMKLLNSHKSGKISSSCDQTFLDLGRGNLTPELAVTRNEAKTGAAENDATITEDTARESDLFERIDSIKEFLSRRELSGEQNPIDDESVAEIRAEVSMVVRTLVKKRRAALAQEKELKQHLLEDISMATVDSIEESATDEAMCASPTMVEKMVERGLDSMRNQADLQSTLITTVFNVLADETDDDVFRQIMGDLDKEMRDIDVPTIDFGGRKSSGDTEIKSMPRSDKRKTLSYVVDGPVLGGIASSIDYVVEMISGYNDYVDELFDYIMNRYGVSVGTAAVDGVSNFVRRFPLPEIEKLRKSGILGGGRIRSLVEE